MAVLTFISVIYGPEGDGEEARSHVTLMKVTVKKNPWTILSTYKHY
jgi:hypothetical protein